MNKAKKITIGTLMAGALLCGGLALGGCGGTSYTLSVEGNATAGASVQMQRQAGEEVTLETSANLGYVFLGWYEGEARVATSLSYTFTMPESDKTVAAKWQKDPLMEKLTFQSTPTTCVVTGLANDVVTEIVLPKYVTAIAESAFEDCEQLQSVTMDESLTEIGKNAFKNSGVFQLTIGENTLTLDGEGNAKAAFSSVEYKNGELKVKATGTQHLGYTWGGWYDGNTQKASGNSYLLTMPRTDTVLTAKTELDATMSAFEFYSDDVTCVVTGLKDRNATTAITLPDCVTSIADSAFAGCQNLQTVTFGAGLVNIGKFAFYNTGVTELYIGFSTRYDEFLQMNVNVTLGGLLASIGEGAFSGCTQFRKAYLDCKTSKLSAHLFDGCTSLQKLTVNYLIGSIEDHALYGCTTLTEIYYEGGADYWNLMPKGKFWREGVAPTTVTCMNMTKNDISDDVSVAL